MASRHIISDIESFFIRKYGTRGVCLWLLGIPWVVLGIGFILNPMERFSKPGPGGALDFLDKGPGIYIFAAVWLVGGITAMIAAIQRPRTCKDDWGFVGVVIPPFMWGAGFFWSQIVYLISGGEFGRPTAYFGMIIYWSFALMLAFLSKRLPDAPEGPCYGKRRT